MTIDDKIRDEKLQYDINRKAAKISTLPSRQIDKSEFLTGKKILPSDRSRTIKQPTFTFETVYKQKQLKNKEKNK